jgi:signal transduction histidine kinase
MVIHEFRNPLTSILSTSQLLQLDDPRLTKERRQEYLVMIQNAVRVMNDLMSDTLSIARTESNQMGFNPQPLDVEEFCHRLIEETQFTTGNSHDIQLRIKGLCLEATLDQKLLWHILSNLVSNAIKYSPKHTTVLLEVICTEGSVMFKVTDSGIGIPESDQAKLFQPFYRAENVGDTPGTGLGLTLVRKCLDMHNGYINIDSVPGRGTTITVQFYAVCALQPAPRGNR